jgi:hypothetical protein
LCHLYIRCAHELRTEPQPMQDGSHIIWLNQGSATDAHTAGLHNAPVPLPPVPPLPAS